MFAWMYRDMSDYLRFVVKVPPVPTCQHDFCTNQQSLSDVSLSLSSLTNPVYKVAVSTHATPQRPNLKKTVQFASLYTVYTASSLQCSRRRRWRHGLPRAALSRRAAFTHWLEACRRDPGVSDARTKRQQQCVALLVAKLCLMNEKPYTALIPIGTQTQADEWPPRITCLEWKSNICKYFTSISFGPEKKSWCLQAHSFEALSNLTFRKHSRKSIAYHLIF